jgi:hypothetical protein
MKIYIVNWTMEIQEHNECYAYSDRDRAIESYEEIRERINEHIFDESISILKPYDILFEAKGLGESRLRIIETILE